MENKIDKNTVYAALKLIEYLYKNGKIKQHVFKNIVDEYKDYIDVSEFQYYNLYTA